jgi:cell division inhibitor SepF
MRRAMVYLGLVPEDYEYDEEFVTEPEPLPAREVGVSREPAFKPLESEGVRPIPGGSVVPISSGSSVRTIQSTKPRLIVPNDFKDAQEVGDHFKGSRAVIINLQDADDGLRRRLIDFCSGLTYALEGTMERVAKNVFLLTPANVEISAEARRRLQEDGFNGR